MNTHLNIKLPSALPALSAHTYISIFTINKSGLKPSYHYKSQIITAVARANLDQAYVNLE